MSTEIAPTNTNTPGPVGTPAESQPDTPGDERKPPREASYRVERNQAREERDALANQVRELQQRDAERLASKGLSQPADLFTLGGVELDDLLDDSGFVDADRVSEVVSEILGSRPGLRSADRAVDPSQSLGAGSRAEVSWSDMLRTGVTA